MNSDWIYAKGFWSQTPENQLKLIKKVTPSSISDKIPPAPIGDYFIAPGYWNYAEASDSYSWLSGKWVQSNSSWVLAPSTYIWRPSGYVFTPLHWDWPLEKRGSAYSCQDNNAPLIAIQSETILQRLFVFYPDYSLFYWHWCLYQSPLGMGWLWVHSPLVVMA